MRVRASKTPFLRVVESEQCPAHAHWGGTEELCCKAGWQSTHCSTTTSWAKPPCSLEVELVGSKRAALQMQHGWVSVPWEQPDPYTLPRPCRWRGTELKLKLHTTPAGSTSVSFTPRIQCWRKMLQEPQIWKVSRGAFINTVNSGKMSSKSLRHRHQS